MISGFKTFNEYDTSCKQLETIIKNAGSKAATVHLVTANINNLTEVSAYTYGVHAWKAANKMAEDTRVIVNIFCTPLYSEDVT